MTTKDDGGPAFPVPCGCEVSKCTCSIGMSLRDYFAAKVLTEKGSTFSIVSLINNEAREVAEGCYRIADAMIAARHK